MLIHLVNQLGYGRLRSNKPEDIKKAIAYFKMNTENFPNSYNTFDSLGEADEIMGDNEKAIANFEKSLELNPNNEHAKLKIETLKVE